MEKDIIICIGREYGSMGHEIGRRLAEKLDIPFYDKKLIERTSKESGISEELFKAVEEQQTTSFLYSIAMSAYSYASRISSAGTVSMSDRLFLVQNDVLKKIAAEGSCVIVGRCAGYVLNEDFNCLRAFFHANMEDKIDYVIKIGAAPDAKKAKEVVARIDKKRANYFNYYTSEKWGSKESNDIILNSSEIGIDGCVEILEKMVQLKIANMK